MRYWCVYTQEKKKIYVYCIYNNNIALHHPEKVLKDQKR